RRQAEAGRIREKYPDRIPVIVEKAERSDIPDIDKKKLVAFSLLYIEISRCSMICSCQTHFLVNDISCLLSAWIINVNEFSRIEQDKPTLIPVNVLFLNILLRSWLRYLVPADLTVGQFIYVVRKRIKLSAEKAIFVFVKNTLPPTAALMSAIYEENRDEDGFLYMTYSGENTFGSPLLLA
ncbi:hypothetical protein Gohar_025847, partial [Gossypium harknessii]|nr:hypothetical protein [Gossypium harknessii]